MTVLFYDTLRDDATNEPLDRIHALPPDYLPDSIFPFPRALYPSDFHPQILGWAATFFAAYNLRPDLSAFFDAPYVNKRGTRPFDDSAWERLWFRLLWEVGDE